MAGHHQWFTVKRLKGILDPTRGTHFERLAKEIAAASTVRGDDPDGAPAAAVTRIAV